MSLFSRLHVQLRERLNPILGPWRRKKMLCDRPTVISNNCWAGHCCRYFRWLPYAKPTIGLYFFADDYIRFLQRLDYYLSVPLTFIPPTASKYHDILVERGETHVPIGVLDDVEIVFLHYHSQEEALLKWNRRLARINRNQLYVKFSEMNGCTYAHLEQFDKLPFPNKFVFTKERHDELSSAVYYKGYERKEQIENDTTWFQRGFDLMGFFNRPFLPKT